MNKIINLFENTTNQTSNFTTKNWVDMNDNVRIKLTLDLAKN